jgi:TPR repeat protein
MLSFPLYASLEKGSAALAAYDFVSTVKYWLPLAKEGNTDVAASIAVMYHTGTGVKRDYEQAFYWYKQAAVKGNKAAQANLGVMYAKGTGTKRDYVESYAWYSVAAEDLPMDKVGSALWGIDYIATQMTPQEVDQAKKLTDTYIKKYLVKPAKK